MKDDCTSLSVLAISFNFQVKRDGRESNRATNLSPPPRLKMTDIKQNQQTTKKSKVSIILPPNPPPPHPNEKVQPVGERLKTRFFLQTGKNNTPPPKKNNPPPTKSPVQSRVQSLFSNWPIKTPQYVLSVCVPTSHLGLQSFKKTHAQQGQYEYKSY